jgi:hypothetical protein
MATKNNIQPKFLLKNINVRDLQKKYKSGYFNRPIPIKKNIPWVKLQPNVIVNNTVTPFVNYKSIQLSGEKYVELYKNHQMNGGRCDYCKCDFTSEIIGYPIAYEEQQKLLDDNTYKIIHLFWIEGCFHSYECCYAYIINYDGVFNKYNLEFDVKVMFKYMYSLLFDKNELKPAKDPKLLIVNGGSMTLNEWEDQNVHYVRSNEVIKIPAQVVYHKI